METLQSSDHSLLDLVAAVETSLEASVLKKWKDQCSIERVRSFLFHAHGRKKGAGSRCMFSYVIIYG